MDFILGAIIILLVLAFVLITGAGIVLRLLSSITAKEKTTATVIKINQMYTKDYIYFVPTIKFYVDGLEYITTTGNNIDEGSIKPNDIIEIRYRKSNPNDAYINKSDNTIIFSTIFVLIFILSIGFAVLPFFKAFIS